MAEEGDELKPLRMKMGFLFTTQISDITQAIPKESIDRQSDWLTGIRNAVEGYA